MKNKLFRVVFMLAIMMAPVFVYADPIDPGDDPDVPIDGGLSLLLAAGVGYIAKKGYDARKKNAEFRKSTLDK